eukprot:COSAG01_NODE_43973_length_424_cov_0.676923_1_plen_49_part_10
MHTSSTGAIYIISQPGAGLGRGGASITTTSAPPPSSQREWNSLPGRLRP